ncbi:MAG: electron transport complex subunit RsxC [Blautia sp.]|nr:electron transport complex subunit RsxC [Blautia sp.]
MSLFTFEGEERAQGFSALKDEVFSRLRTIWENDNPEGLLTFVGGVHPYEGKELTKDLPLERFKPQGEMVFPVSQHIGAPATPLVKKGDKVLRGQMIAEAGGFVSAHVFSSVSGTVKAVEPRLVPTGAMVNSIVIENDGEYTEVEYTPAELSELSKEEIRARIRAGGVVGMGGAGFPTDVKLSPKEPDKIEYVMVNGAECEPYLTSDHRRMLDEPEAIVDGLRCILALFDNAQGCICIENNKPECIERMQELVKDEPRMEVKVLLTKYPQGGERNIIKAVTGREINSTMLPADVGCVVDNVDTVSAIADAVLRGKPVMSKIVTVTGNGVVSPKNFLAPTGTDMYELIEACGGLRDGVTKVIAGGPMMGFAMYDLHVPCTKTTAACTCFVEDPVLKDVETACINCGRCVEACPSHVLPTRLAAFADRGDLESFQEFDGMECCECGCCSYVCPAKRQLTQSIKSMRRMILNNRKKK